MRPEDGCQAVPDAEQDSNLASRDAISACMPAGWDDDARRQLLQAGTGSSRKGSVALVFALPGGARLRTD
jgi:hypothetical protein